MFIQGRPTEAMKEVKVAEYGELVSKDFLPGAEILRDSNEIEQEVKEQGSFQMNLLYLASLVGFSSSEINNLKFMSHV